MASSRGPSLGPGLSVPSASASSAAALPPALPSAPPPAAAPDAASESWSDAAQRFLSTTSGKVAVGVAVAAVVGIGAYALLSSGSGSGSGSGSSAAAAGKRAKAAAPAPAPAPATPKKTASSAGAAAPATPTPASAAAAAPTTPQPSNDEKEKEKEKEKEEKSAPATPRTREERARLAKEAKEAGNKLFANRQYEKAIELYTEAIEIAPEEDKADLAVYYSNRAACYNNVPNQQAKVIEDCTKALDFNLGYTKAWNRRGGAYENMQNYSEALFNYTAQCFLEQFQKQDTVQAADRVLRLLGKNEAEKQFKTRSARMPSTSFVTTYLESFRSKETEPADPPAQEGVEPTEADAAYRAALASIRAHEYDQALKKLEEAVTQKTTYMAEALNARGTFLYLRGDLEAALSDFNASLALDPTSVNGLIKRGSIYMEMGDSAGALADFKKAEEIDPNNSDVYYHRGQVDFLNGKLEDAISDYRKSMSLNNDVPFVHIQLAVALYRDGNIGDAIATFERAKRRFPQSADVFIYYGEILMDQQKFDEAEAMFDAAAKLAPENALCYLNKGLLAFQSRQDTESAIAMAKKALEVDERCDIAYAHLAQMYLQQENQLGAIDCYDKAASMTRTEPEMANILACREAAVAQMRVIATLGSPSAPSA